MWQAVLSAAGQFNSGLEQQSMQSFWQAWLSLEIDSELGDQLPGAQLGVFVHALLACLCMHAGSSARAVACKSW
jgi:hypothetical protein